MMGSYLGDIVIDDILVSDGCCGLDFVILVFVYFNVILECSV